MKTDKTDKKEEILSKRYVTDKGFNGGDHYIYNSMQEHTDQAIAAYKLKLKEAINDSRGIEETYDIIELIDATTI